jgi:hypothetical protein
MVGARLVLERAGVDYKCQAFAKLGQGAGSQLLCSVPTGGSL